MLVLLIKYIVHYSTDSLCPVVFLFRLSLVIYEDHRPFYHLTNSCIIAFLLTSITNILGYTLKNKSEVASIFPTFHPLVENVFKTKISSIYIDEGGEFIGLQPYLKKHGIEHLISPPYTPQRVAIAERRYCHILETAKTVLHEASLPSELWSFTCQYAVYLINRLPTPIFNNESPYQKLFGRSLTITP